MERWEGADTMTQIHWARSVSGDFSNAADWTGGGVPGPSDQAVLDSTGVTPYTVTVGSSRTVASLQTAVNATLTITNGAASTYFDITNGTAGGVNAGVISVGAPSTGPVACELDVGGAFDNAGTLYSHFNGRLYFGQFPLNTAGSFTSMTNSGLILGADDSRILIHASNNGGSGIGLDNLGTIESVGNSIVQASVDILVNRGTLLSEGYLAEFSATLINTGLISCTSGGLELGAGFEQRGPAVIENTGHIVNSGAGTIGMFGDVTLDDSRGGSFDPGGHFDIVGNGVVLGGTMTLAAGAVVTVAGAVDLSTALTNDGANFQIGVDSSLTLHEASLFNAGTIGLLDEYAYLIDQIGAVGGATLVGGGLVTLSELSSIVLAGSTSDKTLTNLDNRLTGSGTIGGGHLSLVNMAGGLIDACASDGSAMTLDASAGSLVNAGLIETTGAGGLVIQHGVVANRGTIANSGTGGLSLIDATIEELGAGALLLAARTVLLASGADSVVGSLTNHGAIIEAAGATLTVQGPLSNPGTISATGAAVLAAGGTLANAGLVAAKTGGALSVTCAVANSGRLEVVGGTLTFTAPVSGAGLAVIAGGVIDFTASFDQRVQFLRPSGELELARSQDYSGAVFGFSSTGGTSLDLRDIGFVGAGEASFSGTASKGVLSVSDGAHTAKIILVGDYLGTTFTASSDGGGGTSIVASTHRLTAAMAGLASPASPSATAFAPAPAPSLSSLAKPAG